MKTRFVTVRWSGRTTVSIGIICLVCFITLMGTSLFAQQPPLQLRQDLDAQYGPPAPLPPPAPAYEPERIPSQTYYETAPPPTPREFVSKDRKRDRDADQLLKNLQSVSTQLDSMQEEMRDIKFSIADMKFKTKLQEAEKTVSHDSAKSLPQSVQQEMAHLVGLLEDKLKHDLKNIRSQLGQISREVKQEPKPYEELERELSALSSKVSQLSKDFQELKTEVGIISESSPCD